MFLTVDFFDCSYISNISLKSMNNISQSDQHHLLGKGASEVCDHGLHLCEGGSKLVQYLELELLWQAVDLMTYLVNSPQKAELLVHGSVHHCLNE